MVLAATVPFVAYVGNGSANTFPITFPLFDQTDIIVLVVNTVTGVAESLDIGVDYSVTGLNSPGDPATTGNIVLINASQAWLSAGNLATNWTLSIALNNPLVQSFSFRNQGDFYRTSIENALDYQMQCIQQLAGAGSVLTDIVTGFNYRLIMINGVLSQIRVS